MIGCQILATRNPKRCRVRIKLREVVGQLGIESRRQTAGTGNRRGSIDSPDADRDGIGLSIFEQRGRRGIGAAHQIRVGIVSRQASNAGAVDIDIIIVGKLRQHQGQRGSRRLCRKHNLLPVPAPSGKDHALRLPRDAGLQKLPRAVVEIRRIPVLREALVGTVRGKFPEAGQTDAGRLRLQRLGRRSGGTDADIREEDVRIGRSRIHAEAQTIDMGEWLRREEGDG